MKTNDPVRYTRTAMALHWLLALAILGAFALGLYVADLSPSPERLQFITWHKWAGITILALSGLRLLWRLTHRPPTLPDSLPVWQTLAAHVNHAVLYVCMVAMPVSGFLGSSFTAYPIKFFGTPLPRLWEASADFKEVFSAMHTAFSYAFMLTIAIHILAALWHALRRDGIAKRMLR